VLFFFFDFLLNVLRDGDLVLLSLLLDLLSLSDEMGERWEHSLLFLLFFFDDELPYLSYESPFLFLKGELRKKTFLLYCTN
jgi:hypothetical protein